MTERQQQVIKLLAEGKSVKEAAAVLKLSEGRAYAIAAKVKLKLGAKSDVHLGVLISKSSLE